MRPSKRFFYDHFKNDIEDTKESILAADIAAAFYKNYSYFKSKKYLAVDIDENKLKNKPVQTIDSPIILSESGDLYNFNLSYKGEIDFIVSTHTISHIVEEKRTEILISLLDHLNKNGNLIINIPFSKEYNKDYQNIMLDNFESVKIIYFRNFISNFYENFISSKNEKNFYISRKNLVHKYIERLLYKLESSQILNYRPKQVYYYCKNKKS